MVVKVTQLQTANLELKSKLKQCRLWGLTVMFLLGKPAYHPNKHLMQ